MGRWTYYAPLWLGILCAAILYAHYWQQLPPMPMWFYPLTVPLFCILNGLGWQLIMIGVQGAFAQVLPVPGGRSIRGGTAIFVGGLILACKALGLIAGLLFHENLRTVGIIVGILSLAAAAMALIGYFWGLPTAVRDFAEER